MKNKVLYLIIWSSLLLSISSMAQRGPGGPPPSEEKKERIEAMKIGFLTEQLNLTPDEAKVFWPVYDQYQGELEKLRKERRKNMMNAHERLEEMSDAEIEKAVDGEIVFRQAELDIIKKYHPQFKKVLPIRKVGRLYRAEEEFKRELLNKLQDGKGGRRQGPPPGGRK
jgi:Spy/CpxP family protein refolding chaperone